MTHHHEVFRIWFASGESCSVQVSSQTQPADHRWEEEVSAQFLDAPHTWPAHLNGKINWRFKEGHRFGPDKVMDRVPRVPLPVILGVRDATTARKTVSLELHLCAERGSLSLWQNASAVTGELRISEEAPLAIARVNLVG